MKKVLLIAVMICIVSAPAAMGQTAARNLKEVSASNGQAATISLNDKKGINENRSNTENRQKMYGKVVKTSEIKYNDRSEYRKYEVDCRKVYDMLVTAEEAMKLAEEVKNEAMMNFMNLRATHMNERAELAKRHSFLALNGSTDELKASHDREMKELEERQSIQMSSMQSTLDRANRKYADAVEEYNRILNRYMR